MTKGLSSDDCPPEHETTLCKQFPCLSLGDLDVPGIVVDRDGRILVWYLPGIIPEQLTVSLNSICILHVLISNSLNWTRLQMTWRRMLLRWLHRARRPSRAGVQTLPCHSLMQPNVYGLEPFTTVLPILA
jgi:hypothetical protein